MSNDFLVFGGDGAANVIDQTTYAALVARLAGFSSGVAQSAQLNKVWRQSSIMAAVLAQLVADVTGQNVVDDGTVATILANLKAAVSAQSNGIVGTARNAKMVVAAASASATFTADELIVAAGLGGLTYRLGNFSKTINLATTGAGGMDTGTAPTNGYVALYAIYNPTTGASAVLAKNATSAVQTTVYSGANMPTGYTASALIGLWGTDGTGKFRIGIQRDRRVSFPFISVMTGATSVAWASVSIAIAVPPGAKAWGGNGACALTAAAASNGLFVAGDANGTGLQTAVSPVGSSSAQSGGGINNIPIITEQTMFYQNTVSNAISNATISYYEF